MRGFPETQYQYVQMRTITSYLIINSCCIVFQAIIQRNDEFNQRLLSKLRDKSDEIAAQNEELMQSEENLSRVNLHLENLVEERTKKIREQNEALLKYAYANAHHVRGPVARVLGLIEISKMKTDLDFPWFFEKVENEAKTIDTILKRIANDFEPDIGEN
jgi:signal transduction histidine kinase